MTTLKKSSLYQPASFANPSVSVENFSISTAKEVIAALGPAGAVNGLSKQ